MFFIFKVDLTELRLATVKAYNCNDRSGIHLKKECIFFKNFVALNKFEMFKWHYR